MKRLLAYTIALVLIQVITTIFIANAAHGQISAPRQSDAKQIGLAYNLSMGHYLKVTQKDSVYTLTYYYPAPQSEPHTLDFTGDINGLYQALMSAQVQNQYVTVNGLRIDYRLNRKRYEIEIDDHTYSFNQMQVKALFGR